MKATLKCQVFISLLFGSYLTLYSQQLIKTWEVLEISMDAKGNYSNPYASIPAVNGNDLVTVQFKGVSGEARGKEYTIVGFWDGGQTWKARFAANVPGSWSYFSISSDPGLNGHSGTFEAIPRTSEELKNNPANHGFIKVHKTGQRTGRYFEYSDGTPFLWIGDTWWNWAKKNIPFSRFRSLVDDRAAKGFSIGQLFVPGNGWGKESFILNTEYDQIDIPHMQKIDSMIMYANSKGITVWVHAWWARNKMKDKIGEEKMFRWWRYLVHRLGAYNVIWILAGEYNMDNYGGMGLDFWKKLGAMVKAEDPWERIVSTHVTPPTWSGGADAPQWSTAEALGSETWLDYNQSQVGHGKAMNEMIPWVITDNYRREPAKPIVVTEPWYEFVTGSAPAEDIRFGAWSAILSGAAGHSYAGGHVWKAHVPESPLKADNWPMDLLFSTNTLDYPGAISMGVMARFLKSIEWWKLDPHPEFVGNYPAPFCSAIPGELYLVYLRYGGSFNLDLLSVPKNTKFQMVWINPSDGSQKTDKIIEGGRKQLIYSPTVYPETLQWKDWLLYLHKTDIK